MRTKSIVPIWGTRLFPALVLFNMVSTQTVPMNKYIVWTSETSADRFDADLIISLVDEVLFFLNGRHVKSYNKEDFQKYNPTWVEVETT